MIAAAVAGLIGGVVALIGARVLPVSLTQLQLRLWWRETKQALSEATEDLRANERRFARIREAAVQLHNANDMPQHHCEALQKIVGLATKRGDR